jgi:hypothetical protein
VEFQAIRLLDQKKKCNFVYLNDQKYILPFFLKHSLKRHKQDYMSLLRMMTKKK